MRQRLIALAAAAALAAPIGAAADHPFGNVPWTQSLPPRPGVPAKAEPVQPCGAAPQPSCVDGVIAQMYDAWTPLDLTCDHRAVFALTYLRTTEKFREYLSDKRGAPFFADEAAIIQLDRAFADLYFEAFSAYPAGAVPPAWRAAFDAAASGRTDGVQDLFLGMNAHIQRDLPVALESVGLVQANGASRKGDHDRVNEILASVVDEFQAELTARYDPHFSLIELSPSPADEIFSLETLKLWREGAWRNAERLALARDERERDQVMQQIEVYSTAWASLIAATDSSWHAKQRDAHCARHEG
jgi:hypothetical protein